MLLIKPLHDKLFDMVLKSFLILRNLILFINLYFTLVHFHITYVIIF